MIGETVYQPQRDIAELMKLYDQEVREFRAFPIG